MNDGKHSGWCNVILSKWLLDKREKDAGKRERG